MSLQVVWGLGTASVVLSLVVYAIPKLYPGSERLFEWIARLGMFLAVAVLYLFCLAQIHGHRSWSGVLLARIIRTVETLADMMLTGS